ncbi:MAG: mucoidy inhibitor MuiA family protein, partial [Flavisolibacter sp.]|nr:mucoidy inhibitor MuiA family protein [Flavisolibacter sp.]
MQIKTFCAVLALFIYFQSTATNEPLFVPSSLKAVTVFRSGAEMTHNSSASLQSGNQDLVIENLSNGLDLNSIQVNCAAAVTIMGIEYSNNFLIAPAVSARIKLLQDSAALLQKDLDKVNMQMQTAVDLLEVLKLNREIKGQQTGLSVAELMKLMEYYKSKTLELQNDLMLQRDKSKSLGTLIARLRNQIKEEESRNTRNAGQLRLQLSVATPGKYDFIISYLTKNAYWSPFYDIRVDDIKSPLKLIYKAKLAQTTGIDWKKIKLTLSTAVPNQWGDAPVLKAWFLSYINPVVAMERTLARNRVQSFAGSTSQLNEVVVTGYG